MKVILNKAFGGFHPSPEAYAYYAKKKGLELFAYELGEHLKYHRAQNPNGLFVSYATKDLGDEPCNDEFYNCYLNLNHKYREDPVLIEAVEKLGKAASSCLSNLCVVEIPDGLDYVIDDYDGFETLHQRVQEW